MKALLILFHKYYLKSFFGPFFAFIFPILVLGTFGVVATDKSTIIPGVLGMVMVSVGMNGIPNTLVDFKTSVLMKRIGTTPIKRWSFSLVIIGYFTVLTIISVGWTFLWSAIMFSGSIAQVVSYINFGELIFAIVATALVSVSLGFFIGIVAKNAAMAGLLGTLLGISSNFLSGQLIPIDQISASPVLSAISHIFPFRYSTGLLNSAFNSYDPNALHPGIFDLKYDFSKTYSFQGGPKKTVVLYYIADKYLNIFIPFVSTVITAALTVKLFKWGRR